MEYYVSGKVDVNLQIPTFQVAVKPYHELLLKLKSMTGLIGKESLGTVEIDFDGYVVADSKDEAKKKIEDELLNIDTWTGSLYYDDVDGIEIDDEVDVVESVNIKEILVEESV